MTVTTTRPHQPHRGRPGITGRTAALLASPVIAPMQPVEQPVDLPSSAAALGLGQPGPPASRPDAVAAALAEYVDAGQLADLRRQRHQQHPTVATVTALEHHDLPALLAAHLPTVRFARRPLAGLSEELVVVDTATGAMVHVRLFFDPDVLDTVCEIAETSPGGVWPELNEVCLRWHTNGRVIPLWGADQPATAIVDGR